MRIPVDLFILYFSGGSEKGYVICWSKSNKWKLKKKCQQILSNWTKFRTL